jgi:intein/homing endonuclease
MLALDSRVYLLDEGVYRPIRELAGRTGFNVLAVDDETLALEPLPVTNAFATGRKPVYRLTTRLGRSIRATGNHKFLAFDGWRRLDDMAPGMELATPRELPGPDQQTLPDQHVAMLGHLLSGPVTTGERRVPAEVFRQPTHVIGLFLHHLLGAEAASGGLVYPISFETTSGKLVRDLQSLLLRLGISAERRAVSREDGPPSYRLQITEIAHLERYLSVAGRTERAAVGVAAGAPARGGASWRSTDESGEGAGDVVWDEVVSIETDGEDDVYDLTVEGLHSFVAEDVVVDLAPSG